MQVFIIGSPFETAQILDKKRLNRQIQEAKVILDALNGAKAWSNHPCVLQYRGHEEWLKLYKYILEAYRYPHASAVYYDLVADKCRPPFHTQEYFDQMKRRLYAKDKEYYAQWAHLGESEDNWYFVDGEWRIYNNGKRIK